jgi:hypothetical protein
VGKPSLFVNRYCVILSKINVRIFHFYRIVFVKFQCFYVSFRVDVLDNGPVGSKHGGDTASTYRYRTASIHS